MRQFSEQKMGGSQPQERPTAAEVARTIVAGPHSACILTEWLVDPCEVSFWANPSGRPILFVGDGHPLARVTCLHTNPSADLLVEAVSAARGPDRLIGAVEITGQLAPVTPIAAAAALASHARSRGLDDASDLGRLWTLEVRPQRIELTVGADSHRIDVDGYVAAEPDPFAESAHRIAEHLNESHREVLLELLPGVPTNTRITVVGLDRYGLDLCVDSVVRRVRFRNPLTRREELGRELFELRRLRVHA